jgi:2'-5' RNA ligase
VAHQTTAPRRGVSLPNWIRHPLWWLPDIPAEQDRSYDRIWDQFHEIDVLADGRHDTEAWTRRDGDFVLCCVRVPGDALTGAYRSLRAGLEPLAPVRLHPPEFLHIAIQEIGFVTARPKRRDEFGRARLDEFISYIEQPIADFAPFSIELTGVSAFTDAAFLQVRDNGWLSRIHFRLRDFVIVPPNKHFPYLPFATVAHFTGSAPAELVRQALLDYHTESFGSFPVTEIDLVRISTKEPYPPLVLERSFRLGSPRIEAPVRPSPLETLNDSI